MDGWHKTGTAVEEKEEKWRKPPLDKSKIRMQ